MRPVGKMAYISSPACRCKTKNLLESTIAWPVPANEG